jgi:outer membrane protein TolC
MRALSLAVVAMLAAPASAQEVLRLTLDEAVTRALEQSASLAVRRAERGAAQAALDGARAERLPRLGLDASYTRFSDVREFTALQPDGTERVLFPNLPNRSRVQLGVSVPLYAGGRITAGIDSARHREEAAASDVRSAVADLVLETRVAYWSLVTALESERVLTEALASYDAHLQDAEARERFGVAARNEVLAVQVERDRAELRQLEAQEEAARARADLARLLALSPTQVVEPVDDLTAPQDPPADLEPLVTQALDTRPERQALQSRAAAAAARVQVAKAARLPELELGGAYIYANPNFGILPPQEIWEDTWQVDLRLRWNAFDGGRAAAQAAQARAEADAARARLDDLDRSVRQQVTERFLALRTARASVRVAERSLESATENRRVAMERHREGVIPSAERLDAETALLRAGLDLALSRARVRTALAGLDRAVGR